MDRHDLLEDLSLLRAALAAALMALHFVDALNDDLIRFWERANDRTFGAFLLASDHYDFVSFFDVHMCLNPKSEARNPKQI